MVTRHISRLFYVNRSSRLGKFLLANNPPRIKPLYSGFDEDARFREQNRLVFAGTIVASYLASDNFKPLDFDILGLPVRTILALSALASALYLLATAIHLQYFGSGWIEETIYVSRWLRRALYDLSVSIYAVCLFGVAFSASMNWLTHRAHVNTAAAYALGSLVLLVSWFLCLEVGRRAVLEDIRRGLAEPIE